MLSTRGPILGSLGAFRDFLATSYPPHPWEAQRDPSFPPDCTYAMLHSERFHRILREFALHGGGATALLDVGVYPGVLPRLLRRVFTDSAGWSLHGTGMAFTPAFRDAMAAEGVVLHEADLDPPPRVPPSALRYPSRTGLPDGSIDFAFMAEVIEHLVWPLGALGELHRVVKPGGSLLVTTNNAARIGGLLRQLRGYSAQETIKLSHIFTDAANEWRGHVRLFAMDELVVMLEAAGFEVVERAYYSANFDGMRKASWLRRAWQWLRSAAYVIPWFREDMLVIARRR